MLPMLFSSEEFPTLFLGKGDVTKRKNLLFPGQIAASRGKNTTEIFVDVLLGAHLQFPRREDT